MASITPVTGQTAKIRTVVGNTNTELAAINWSLNIDGNLKDASNNRDGRFRVKTLQDATISCTVVHDGSAAAYLAANGSLIDGQAMSILCFTNTNASFTVPAMIATVTPKNDGPEGIVMIDVTASLHNGSVTYASS